MMIISLSLWYPATTAGHLRIAKGRDSINSNRGLFAIKY